MKAVIGKGRCLVTLWIFFQTSTASTTDNTPPVIEQLDDIIITITSGQANIAQVTWEEPSVSDDSGTATLVSRTREPNSFFQVGTTPVTYTYTDPSGNQASMTFNVIVNVIGGKQLLISSP